MKNRRKHDLEPVPVDPAIKEAVGRCFGIMGALDPADKEKAVAEFERKAAQDQVLNKRGAK